MLELVQNLRVSRRLIPLHATFCVRGWLAEFHVRVHHARPAAIVLMEEHHRSIPVSPISLRLAASALSLQAMTAKSLRDW